MIFKRRYDVRFKHCDPAGIVFYPRYFEMINDLVEDWFAELEWDFCSLHQDKAAGIPTAHIAVTFTAPSALGDSLDWSLSLLTLGTSSFELAYRAQCRGEERLTGSARLVYISSATNTIQSTPIPEALRQRMHAYLSTEERLIQQ